MGYSRASYVEYVNNEKIETLIGCHMNAFAYLVVFQKSVY
ncbi:transposase [Sulfurospirillum diekertiae]|nr:transposase [Sulfurospirillum diekertiae]